MHVLRMDKESQRIFRHKTKRKMPTRSKLEQHIRWHREGRTSGETGDEDTGEEKLIEA